MLMFAAWFLAGLGVAWWVFPLGTTFFTVPLLPAAALLWLLSVNRLPSHARWPSALAALPAFAAFVAMIVPALLMAPAVKWALISHRRGLAVQGVTVELVVSVLVGAAAGWLQALAVQWRTGSSSRPSRRMILLGASFGPTVAMFIGAISLFWPLND